jgi:hypothetical protein
MRELALLQRLDDACQHSFEIPQYIIIPESDYFESVSFQPRGPGRVSLDVLGMLAAIHFDDQAVSQAAEVHDVVADRMLAAKLRTFQAFGPQLLPKQALSLGLFAAETADISTQLFRRAHNKELYRRVSEMMGEERNGAEADEESRAEVPLRPVTIFARSQSENPAGPPPPNNGGGASRMGEMQIGMAERLHAQARRP